MRFPLPLRFRGPPGRFRLVGCCPAPVGTALEAWPGLAGAAVGAAGFAGTFVSSGPAVSGLAGTGLVGAGLEALALAGAAAVGAALAGGAFVGPGAVSVGLARVPDVVSAGVPVDGAIGAEGPWDADSGSGAAWVTGIRDQCSSRLEGNLRPLATGLFDESLLLNSSFSHPGHHGYRLTWETVA